MKSKIKKSESLLRVSETLQHALTHESEKPVQICGSILQMERAGFTIFVKMVDDMSAIGMLHYNGRLVCSFGVQPSEALKFKILDQIKQYATHKRIENHPLKYVTLKPIKNGVVR